MNVRRVAAGLLVFGCAAGCAPTVETVGADITRRFLPVIVDGQTSRSEVRAVLGQPMRSFERGRIVTYRLRPERARLVPAATDELPDARYELVLSFDSEHVLVRHSLLRLW